MTSSTALDPRDFALGGRLPAEAFAPSSVAALAELLRTCDLRRRAVVLFGGGTLQSLANVPARLDVAISFARMADVLEYEHRDLTIAVEGGLSVGSLDTALAEHRQFLPLDAPRASIATVGGTLASGWLGPRRTMYGRPRDFVIGATVVLADGTVAKSGGMVVKNSTGYDLAKLYVGSMGTLAAIVRANFKTLPLPPMRRLAIAGLPEGTRARAIAHVNALAVEPAAALLVNGFDKEIEGRDGLDGRIILLYEGSERLVESATRELRSSLGSAGLPETRLLDRDASIAFAHLIDAYVALLPKRSATYRSIGPASDASLRHDIASSVARASDLNIETIEDLRSGDVIARVSSPATAHFEERLLAFDSALRTELPETRVLAAPEESRTRLDGWGKPPASLKAMRELKARFDPNGTLGPGRYVGAI